METINASLNGLVRPLTVDVTTRDSESWVSGVTLDLSKYDLGEYDDITDKRREELKSEARKLATALEVPLSITEWPVKVVRLEYLTAEEIARMEAA